MALRDEILNVINAVVENGVIPDGFAQFLKRNERPHRPQRGNVVTNAYSVFFGPRQSNKDWQLFWECPENEARTLLENNPGLRFDIDNPFAIPSLANGRAVKYYLNVNIGYGPAINALREGLQEYQDIIGRQILDDATANRWTPHQGAYGNTIINGTNNVTNPVQHNVQNEATNVPPQTPDNNTPAGTGDMMGLRNLIFFGAPGTGKSHKLNQMVCSHKNEVGEDVAGCFENADRSECRYERVTFYPTYSYAQFVGTYKPVMKPKVNGAVGEEEIAYEFVPGPFLRVLVKALNNPEKNWCLVIEEINRANAAAVFGDVFQLLDRASKDDVANNVKKDASEYAIAASEDVKKHLLGEKGLNETGKNTLRALTGSLNSLKIPANMYIWATMNSADQGVFPMDTAFKRRWEFDYIGIDDEARGDCLNWHIEGKGYTWNDIRRYINGLLAEHDVNEDKFLGPYFVKADGNNIISKKLFASKVLMYLWEDAGRMIRRNLFGNQIKTYSQLVKEWERNEGGVKVFAQCNKKENLPPDLKNLYAQWTMPHTGKEA